MLSHLSLFFFDFFHECLIHLFICWTHFSSFSTFFNIFLLFEESLRFSIYLLYLILKSLIFNLPYFPLFFPHASLLIQIFFGFSFIGFFHLKLTSQCFSHFLLISLLFLGFLFFLTSQFQFSFTFISHDHFIFFFLNLIQFFKNTISHSIHEFLCSIFSSFNFSHSVLFFLKLNGSILLLHLNVFESILFLFLAFFNLISFIFIKHFHEIFTFLSFLLSLHFSFVFSFNFEFVQSGLIFL